MGCLSGWLLLLLLFVIGLAAVETVMGPWILTVGGRQRFLPVWEGVGDAHGPGGIYRLYLWFAPSPPGERIVGEAAVAGYSVLCTPRGERFNLKLYGWSPGHIWRRMDEGKEFYLSAFRKPPGALSTNAMVTPPRLQFVGRWRGPNLVMDDQGSFAQAFDPNGALKPNAGGPRSATEAVPITFTEQSWGLISSPPCSPPPVEATRAP